MPLRGQHVASVGSAAVGALVAVAEAAAVVVLAWAWWTTVVGECCQGDTKPPRCRWAR